MRIKVPEGTKCLRSPFAKTLLHFKQGLRNSTRLKSDSVDWISKEFVHSIPTSALITFNVNVTLLQ